MRGKTPAARAVALAALTNIETNRAFSGHALQAEAKKFPLSSKDERLVWRLVLGVICYRLSLDYVLNQFCRRSPGTLSPTLRNILRLACYQMIYLDRIPDFAAVNEAVNMARKAAGQKVAGFVNGVLRNVARNRDSLFQDLTPQSAEGISVLHSHPRWMVEAWIKRWGPEFTASLCEANNQPVSLTIRVNTHKISVEEYSALAAEKGLSPKRSHYCDDALVFSPDTAFSLLPGFQEGHFIVQGEASMLTAACLDLAPGQMVLDMCSAPGGKTTHIAARVLPGVVTACDLYESRLRLVQANAARLGLDNIELIQADAARLSPGALPRYDRILLDAPCSGLGVIRKKPDIKWSRKPEDIHDLSALQLKLLHTGCELLKPGGILVYSTCTVMEQENQGPVRALLKERQDLRIADTGRPDLADAEGFINTYPHLHDLDGFFIAKLIKVV